MSLFHYPHYPTDFIDIYSVDVAASVAPNFDDALRRKADLPDDYAIKILFTASVNGNMGRLPFPGVVWRRKSLSLPAIDEGKSMLKWIALHAGAARSEISGLPEREPRPG